MDDSEGEQQTLQEEETTSSSRQLIKVPLGINLRDEFDTYEEFDKLLKELSRKNFVHFWKRDCRTVEGAKKKTERYIDPKIKYYQLKYSCVHGGRMFKKKTEANLDSKPECEANFYLIATQDGKKLFVKSLNNHHNHEVSEATYLKYFIEEKVKRGKRGRPRKKIMQVKQEINEYTTGYLYSSKFESETEEGNMHLDNTAEYPITVNVPQYESPSDHNTMLQYESSLCNQNTNINNNAKEDDIDHFLKYLGCEMRQIKNKKVIKTLKRKFISMIQMAQDDEESS